ncbi:TPA: hydrogenase 3 maturation endopeptidase HyCI [Candidatus Bathyarchaeota archaeon]|nr:hydrogenase 3 maturation endopeptidase HyCI [Candidatus Bathyarchaeota archaeon]
MSLREKLQTFLGSTEGRRVVVVGVGSPIRHDDFAGLRVLELLAGHTPENVLLLTTETVPESYTGTIRDFNPTHILIVDAANFQGTPGEARIIPLNAIANTSISTHSLPLHIFINYIKKSICPNVTLLGIQGVNVDLGEGMTPSVENGAVEAAILLQNLLHE